MTIGSDGFSTILSVAERQLVPSSPPLPPGEPMLAAEPQVAGFLPLLARLAPVPPSDRLVNSHLLDPSPQFGTIILRDGCLKLAEPGEPHAILPAGTKLYIDDEGFLTAGLSANDMATHRD